MNMDKYELNKFQDKILDMEKLLMRDLDANELRYLETHDIAEFLADFLGLDKDSIETINKIKENISALYQEFTKEYDQSDVDMDLFSEDGFDPCDINENLFKSTNRDVNELFNLILNSVSNLREEYENKMDKEIEVETETEENKIELKPEETPTSKYVHRTSGHPKCIITSPVEENKPNEFNFDGLEDWTECTGRDLLVVERIRELIPNNDKKWIDSIDCDSFWSILRGCLSSIVDEITIPIEIDGSKDIINKYKLFDILTNNYFLGDLIDCIKDKVIEEKVSELKCKKQITFLDDEFQSEVIDFLVKNEYKFKSIDNKITLYDEK